MTITVADLRTKFPEVSDEFEYPDAVLQRAIDEAVCIMGDDETAWCEKYDAANEYLAMHFWAGNTATSAGDTGSKIGNVTSKSAGGVSVGRSSPNSAANLSVDDAEFSSTAYGVKFLRLRNSCFMGMYSSAC